jgi:HlyD family secretion protein
VLRDGAPVGVQVHAGVTDGSFTEVVDGDVKEGELVVVDKEDDGKPATPSAGPPGLGGGQRGGGRGF